MNADIRRAIERNAAKHAEGEAAPSLGPIPVLDEEFDPETIPCRECDGHGLATETYDGLGRYSRTDCYVCNGEGRVPNRLTGDY